MNNFSIRLKEILKSKNMTQEELAELAGTTGATISRYANNERTPNADLLDKISSALNVSVDYLLCKSNDPTLPNKKILPETEQDSLINEILKVLPNPTNEEFEKLIDYARYIDSSRDK